MSGMGAPQFSALIEVSQVAVNMADPSLQMGVSALAAMCLGIGCGRCSSDAGSLLAGTDASPGTWSL